MTYNGQRGPNVSEFIANLNAIPSAQDMASQNQDNFNLDEDLAMFTNTQFFDFDLGQDADLQPTNFDFNGQQRRGAPNAASNSAVKGMDFIAGTEDFAFPDFSTFAAPQYGHGGMPMAGQQPLQSASGYPASSSTTNSPPSGLMSPTTGEKRKAESVTDTSYPQSALGFEDESRMAAEEDKRRRNTAASARFRVKKKQREQALEKSAKEMSDKVAALEGKIQQLETENKWLKNLVMEKNENKDDIAALWKKYSQESADRKGTERKDGVGTKA